MTAYVIVHVAQRRPVVSHPVLIHQFDLVMVRKKRPDWQAGKLNLPGGHIEEGEAPVQAGARELFEETGLLVKHMPEMGAIYAGDHVIHVFQACGVTGQLETKTDEPVEQIPFYELPTRDDLVEQNIVIMHALITNGLRGWGLLQMNDEYVIRTPLQNKPFMLD